MGKNPHVSIRDNAVQFTNNPFGGVSAITLGNTVTWNGNPYDHDDSSGVSWREEPNAIEHEKRHTLQSQQLGPAYLPSNILGGAYALARDGRWHGPSNWNEAGPQQNPPRAWPEGRR